LLLIARSFSHSVQATERYYELLNEVGDKRKAAEMSLAVMFAPGALGIFTDVCALLLVGFAPIPANGAIFPVYRILGSDADPHQRYSYPRNCSAYCPRPRTSTVWLATPGNRASSSEL